MTKDLARRDFLKASRTRGAPPPTHFLRRDRQRAPIEVPTVDKLSIRVLVDSSFDQFLPSQAGQGVSIAPPARGADFRKTLHNEWGLSLWLESQARGNQRTLMLDYGYTPEVLLNNMELVGVDPSKLDALIVSHGHYDHFGGLLGFLDKFRDKLRPT
jgi:7,8-dihydropterin-6-yl-methyl-4-(beta-D-ribofuranosyl)aminobenzene 5'-phosphate synthase